MAYVIHLGEPGYALANSNIELLEVLLQIGQILEARLHPPTLVLDFVHPFANVISNNEGAFPIWFQLALIESSSKDKIALAEHPWFDVFRHIMRSSVLVFIHSYDDSLPYLLKFVQSLRELGGSTCVGGLWSDSNGISASTLNARAYEVSLIGYFRVVW